MEPFQKNLGLCSDEMKLLQGLVYKKLSEKLVGFREMGDVNQEIESFAQRK